MYEVLSEGGVPYAGFTDKDIKKLVTFGKSLQAPRDCHPVLAQLMEQCLQFDPEQRPSFTQLNTLIERCAANWREQDVELK